MTAGTHRIFIAVPLDPSLREAVRALETRIEADGARVRWVKPENLHFTLRFLGHIGEGELARVREAARRACAGTGPFRITLGGVGAFPNARRPQVVWIGVGEGAAAMVALAKRLEDALAAAGFSREDREFAPHLTLARVKEPRLWGDLSRVLPSYQGERVGEQAVACIVVMESLLRPQGAVYTPVEEVRLATHEK